MVAEAPRVRCHALGQMVMEVVLIVLSISTCARDICRILGVDVTLSLTGSARKKKGGREAARARERSSIAAARPVCPCLHVVATLPPFLYAIVVCVCAGWDGGYLGLGACGLGLFGCFCVTVFRCWCQDRVAFALYAVSNFFAAGLSLGHAAFTVRLLATVDEWCCVLPETSKDAMRTFLLILVVTFAMAVRAISFGAM